MSAVYNAIKKVCLPYGFFDLDEMNEGSYIITYDGTIEGMKFPETSNEGHEPIMNQGEFEEFISSIDEALSELGLDLDDYSIEYQECEGVINIDFPEEDEEEDDEVKELVAEYYARNLDSGTSPSEMLDFLVGSRVDRALAIEVVCSEFDLEEEEYLQLVSEEEV